MSKILFGLVGIALISSCTRPGSLYNGGQRIANCVTSEPFEVPVQEGCATYVMYGQDTVAIVTQPMTIQIPKGMKVSTKGSTGDEISIEYEVLNDTDAKIAYNKSWQAIMFEDTRSGDYDYNDLIIHVRNLHSWNKLQIALCIDKSFFTTEQVFTHIFRNDMFAFIITDHTSQFDHLLAP